MHYAYSRSVLKIRVAFLSALDTAHKNYNFDKPPVSKHINCLVEGGFGRNLERSLCAPER